MPSKQGAAPFLSADLKLPFIEAVDGDSLGTLKLVLALEEELDMAIPDEDAEKLNSVEDVLE
jgi:acyl carrier protein